jgi:hypothetical protein
MSSTRIRNQDLKEGMLVYHNLEGELGRVKKIHGPGEYVGIDKCSVPYPVVIVDFGGREEQFLLPANGRQFSAFPDAVEDFRDKLRTTVDDTIKSLCIAGEACGLDEHTSMLVIGCVIRENLRKRGQLRE